MLRGNCGIVINFLNLYSTEKFSVPSRETHHKRSDALILVPTNKKKKRSGKKGSVDKRRYSPYLYHPSEYFQKKGKKNNIKVF